MTKIESLSLPRIVNAPRTRLSLRSANLARPEVWGSSKNLNRPKESESTKKNRKAVRVSVLSGYLPIVARTPYHMALSPRAPPPQAKPEGSLPPGTKKEQKRNARRREHLIYRFCFVFFNNSSDKYFPAFD